jgi:hypothetical protein
MTRHVLAGAFLAVGLFGQTTRPALPLVFERNTGQTDAAVLFTARGPGYRIFFTSGGAVLSGQGGAIRMQFEGANPSPEVAGSELLEGTANHLSGDPAGWRTDIPLYNKVVYREVYPGINLVFYGREGQLEYDFLLAPRTSPRDIRLSFDGIESLHLDEQGDLVLSAQGGELRHRRPRLYQERRGRKVEISGEYVILGPREVGFAIGAYDESQPLTIDPVLVYSTYVGGSGSDSAWAIAVDSSGCAYVAGETWGGNFPRTRTIGPAIGNPEAFLVKLNPTGTAILYATYFGGGNRDSARAVAVDTAGNAYVAGFTYSADFPATWRTASPGQEDAFVMKLGPTGGLLYSTLLGAAGSDFATGIALDAAGNAYVSGYTNSVAFPTTAGAVQRAYAGGVQDAFVVKLNAAGTALLYATYLGGSGNDVAYGIAVDSAGSAHVAGFTDSSNFPVQNALRATAAGQGDAFLAKLLPGGNGFSYATYLGGKQPDKATAIAVDASGNAYITGSTASVEFPVTAGAYQTVNRGSHDAFVAKVSLGGALIYATYLGAEGADEAMAIAVDASGNAYIAGHTGSIDFPVQGTGSARFAGARDAFLAVFSNSTVSWSTCIGGAGDDFANAIAVATPNVVYFVGATISSDFPVTPAAYGRMRPGNLDAFVAQVYSDAAPAAPRVLNVAWMHVSTRQAVFWTMTGVEGNTKGSWAWLEQQGLPGWVLISMSDFDRDGLADAIWMHEQTRQAVVRYRSAPGRWAWLNPEALPGWTLVAGGDFNRDSVPDLVWMHEVTRQVVVWYMSLVQGSPAKQSWAWISEQGVPGWKIAAAADFNRDGNTDLVWLNDTSRQAIIWYMGGASGEIPQFWSWLSPYAVPGWRIAGAADFDYDGTPDVTWMEESSGQAVVWYLDRATHVPRSWAWLNESALPGWQLVIAP